MLYDRTGSAISSLILFTGGHADVESFLTGGQQQIRNKVQYYRHEEEKLKVARETGKVKLLSLFL